MEPHRVVGLGVGSQVPPLGLLQVASLGRSSQDSTGIHANPKAAGVRKGFYDPYTNYGHYGRLECDGISEWHPSFLTLAPTLKECSMRYERFCQQYRHHAKGASKYHWGSRMLKRLVETSGSKKKRVSPGQMQLPFVFNLRFNQIPEEWHQIAVRFRRANGIRDGDRERSIW